MVPSVALLAVFTAAVAAAPELFLVVVVFFELELLDPPQAASAIAAAAPRATNAETRPSKRERRATLVPAPAVPWCMPCPFAVSMGHMDYGPDRRGDCSSMSGAMRGNVRSRRWQGRRRPSS